MEQKLNELKVHLKEFTKQQGFKLNNKQFEAIFNLTDVLGIKNIGELTLVYTTAIMPVLENYGFKHNLFKTQSTVRSNSDGTMVVDETDSDEWYDAINERNLLGLNIFVKIKELIRIKYNIDISKECDNIQNISIDELEKFLSKLSLDQVRMVREEKIKSEIKEGDYNP